MRQIYWNSPQQQWERANRPLHIKHWQWWLNLKQKFIIIYHCSSKQVNIIIKTSQIKITDFHMMHTFCSLMNHYLLIVDKLPIVCINDLILSNIPFNWFSTLSLCNFVCVFPNNVLRIVISTVVIFQKYWYCFVFGSCSLSQELLSLVHVHCHMRYCLWCMFTVTGGIVFGLCSPSQEVLSLVYVHRPRRYCLWFMFTVTGGIVFGLCSMSQEVLFLVYVQCHRRYCLWCMFTVTGGIVFGLCSMSQEVLSLVYVHCHRRYCL